MSRTPEQVKADEELTAAIEQAIRAYHDDGDAWVLTEYVVCMAQTRWDDDGDQLTAIATIYRDGDVPAHRALGLVDYVATRLRSDIARSTDPD